MTVRSYLKIASAAVVAGLVAMFLVYVLVFSGVGEFREHCNSLNGVVSETANGIICTYNKEEVLRYE